MPYEKIYVKDLRVLTPTDKRKKVNKTPRKSATKNDDKTEIVGNTSINNSTILHHFLIVLACPKRTNSALKVPWYQELVHNIYYMNDVLQEIFSIYFTIHRFQ